LKKQPLYIETKINCDLDTLWAFTQDPAVHEKWDLRFSSITYLPKDNSDDTQKFVYATKIGFGVAVKGIGESVANKVKSNGESTSVLKFSSDSNISIIRQGSGYWKYVPENEVIKFATGYDYDTRWGIIGDLIDKYIFRKLMIWATAWSFDCLKNWIEKGWHPKQAVNAQLTILLASITLGLVWIYQGLIPKILFPDTGEVEIIRQSGLFAGYEKNLLVVIGMAEIAFGILLIVWQKKWLHIVNIIALLLLLTGAMVSNVAVLTYPFNPVSLNVSLAALSCLSLIHFKYLPKASNCITKHLT
jgi:hypothetical protein